MLCGLRSEQFSERIRKLFQSLNDAGAHLVFFYDGTLQSDKEITWHQRRDQEYFSHLEIIKALENNPRISELLSSGLPLKSASVTLLLVRKVAQEFNKIHVSVNVECDLELAAYASSNNAFAIIADDSDFLIYPGILLLEIVILL